MNDRGQGRKPLSKDGELMKSRPIRMTDAQWADAKLVGMDEIREFVTARAKKKRKAIDKAKEPPPASSEKETNP